MAAASVAWLSVTAKRDVHVVLSSTIVKCSWEETFADLLVKASNELQTSSISTVKIASLAGKTLTPGRESGQTRMLTSVCTVSKTNNGYDKCY